MRRPSCRKFAEIGRLRRDVIEPSLTRHQGRLIKTSGDGTFLIHYFTHQKRTRPNCSAGLMFFYRLGVVAGAAGLVVLALPVVVLALLLAVLL